MLSNLLMVVYSVQEEGPDIKASLNLNFWLCDHGPVTSTQGLSFFICQMRDACYVASDAPEPVVVLFYFPHVREQYSLQQEFDVTNLKFLHQKSPLRIDWEFGIDLYTLLYLRQKPGLPHDPVVKNSPANAGDTGSVPGLGGSRQTWGN